ncbi:MAG: hypothetical protein BWY63_02885 [Chloroflexi bacterium ADurb.Bin360]|nr:MAG: hypothetical protein BWY63_02885 [Chloroflexi bacterium ADurb.Bin360]
MNAFHLARPRGPDMPAKRPTKRKKPTAGKPVRVLNAAGKWQAYLRPSTSIQIEDRAQGQASTDKRRAIVKGSL